MVNVFNSYWSEAVPSPSKIKDIIQIAYCVKQDEADKAKGFCSVYAINTINGNTYKWGSFPERYTTHLKRIFYRLHLFSFACTSFDGAGEDVKSLKKHLRHIDKTLDAMFDARSDSKNADENWRSIVLDQWLLVEYFVKRHTKHDIDDFIRSNGNEWINSDIFELGTSC